MTLPTGHALSRGRVWHVPVALDSYAMAGAAALLATANTLSLEASDDWDLMYRAVLGRLAAAAQAPPSRAAPHLRGAAAAQLRAVLQDCAEAMAWLVDASGHDRHSDR